MIHFERIFVFISFAFRKDFVLYGGGFFALQKKMFMKNYLFHYLHHKRTISIAFAGVLCGISALVFTFFAQAIRLDNLLSPFPWLVTHSISALAGTVVVFLFLMLFCFLFRRVWISATVAGLCIFAGSYACFFKQAYRGDPMLPADILLAKDAAGVAGGMDLSPTVSMVVFGIAVIGVAIALFPFHLKKPSIKQQLLQTIGTGVAMVVWMTGVLWYGPIPKALGLSPIPGRAKQLYDSAGFITGFMSYLGHLSPQVPQGYSSATKTAALQQLPAKQSPTSTPDIVVVMMESYYHLDNYPTVTGCESLTANYDALAKEGVSGVYYSDKYSGGTADMEFGALTGFSTSFLPEGVVPYVQYVSKNENFPAYPSYLKELGYKTIAIHPFDGSIYHRNSAYPNMGFDSFVDMDSMEHTQTAGKYISDQQAAEELIQQYEQACSDGSPVFLHMVTMQNHIPNLPGEYPEEYQATGEIPNVPTYYQESFKSVITGLRDADLMMKQITDYFRTVDREVIVLFFGDHQTAIGQQDGVELLDITKQLEGLSAQEQWQYTHTVPYLMWSNQGCDFAGSDGGSFPPYLLLPTFLSKMDGPISPWFQWLYSTRDTLMGTSAGWILQPDGTISSTASDQQKQLLQLQHTLQYAMMFDS